MSDDMDIRLYNGTIELSPLHLLRYIMGKSKWDYQDCFFIFMNIIFDLFIRSC